MMILLFFALQIVLVTCPPLGDNGISVRIHPESPNVNINEPATFSGIFNYDETKITPIRVEWRTSVAERPINESLYEWKVYKNGTVKTKLDIDKMIDDYAYLKLRLYYNDGSGTERVFKHDHNLRIYHPPGEPTCAVEKIEISNTVKVTCEMNLGDPLTQMDYQRSDVTGVIIQHVDDVHIYRDAFFQQMTVVIDYQDFMNYTYKLVLVNQEWNFKKVIDLSNFLDSESTSIPIIEEDGTTENPGDVQSTSLTTQIEEGWSTEKQVMEEDDITQNPGDVQSTSLTTQIEEQFIEKPAIETETNWAAIILAILFVIAVVIIAYFIVRLCIYANKYNKDRKAYVLDWMFGYRYTSNDIKQTTRDRDTEQALNPEEQTLFQMEGENPQDESTC